MEIEKLEKLSCLKINDVAKPALMASLQGVMHMLHEIDSIKSPKVENQDLLLTTFREEGGQTLSTLESVDGLFLAPKVIKKD